MISIREEKTGDIPAIRALNERAFGGRAEANVVDKLRQTCDGLLSLVAVDGGNIIGYILFSPATVESEHGAICGMGLAPVAVIPERQCQGVGSALVRHGLARLRERDCPFVIVLGHPKYYPRFGFEPASRYGLKSQWDGVPDEAFMVIVFDQGTMKGVHGVARYRDEFDEAM